MPEHRAHAAESAASPVTSYGELEELRLPVRVKAVWKLAEGDREDIDVTLTGLRYDA